MASAQFSTEPAPHPKDLGKTLFAKGQRTAEPLANFSLSLHYTSDAPAELAIDANNALSLPAGAHQLHLQYEHTATSPRFWSARIDGKTVSNLPSLSPAPLQASVVEKPVIRLDRPGTLFLTFRSTGDGTLFSTAPAKGPWAKNARALFIRDGRLVFDIGWVGDATGGPKVTDGKPHAVAVRIAKNGTTEIYLDGKRIIANPKIKGPADASHVFKIGQASPDFGGDLKQGTVNNLRFWDRSLNDKEFKTLLLGKVSELNTPDLNWSPGTEVETFAGFGVPGYPITISINGPRGLTVTQATARPLALANYQTLLTNLGETEFIKGREIYKSLCMTCHGDPDQEGSLPTALRFHAGVFKNGSDPWRMLQTLERGYGMMIPQPQYSTAEKIAVVHYIRESFLKPYNKTQYTAVDAAYTAALPLPMVTRKEQPPTKNRTAEKAWQRMDYGPNLTFSVQVNKQANLPEGNLVPKGLTVRLNPGPGGVAAGNTWITYDLDTLSAAAGWTGSFIDWRCIAFDQSHGTHSSITGDILFQSANRVTWAHPDTGSWEDTRQIGRDDRRYGPLAHDHVRYRGLYHHGEQVVLHYTVGNTRILEQPGLTQYGTSPVLHRTLQIAPHKNRLTTRLANTDPKLQVALKGSAKATIERSDQGILLHLAPDTQATDLVIGLSTTDPASIASLLPKPKDLVALTKGGPQRFKGQEITLEGQQGDASGPFAVDTIPVPNLDGNPWNSWMRLGGFDFFTSDPNRAAVCTWLGDVWLVDGVAGDLSKVTWKRIATGLFQPLGLKIVDDRIYVTCRDQLALLHDYNGDEEIDYIEAFNNDHQVTEHFHEFAMGLQTDAKGNFYYAKSARHAKVAVVPQHGTLLRVSPNGKSTDIVASGFRAANGVCLNPDGTWIVTDQEGHWNPKNRINYVKEGGFYGNMYGYHDVTDESDSAMEQPLAWITNAKDRSPAELVWVPEDAAWGPLNGTLLNLSYGYGMVFSVPHEVIDGQAQGGLCEILPERLPTGIHRGRFHPNNGQLYGVGMFAWAGSQKHDVGFFRVRATGKPSWQPLQLEAYTDRLEISFTDPLPKGSTFEVKTWDLKRTKSYGSKHYNEKKLSITRAEIDGKKVRLYTKNLAPTWGMEIKCTLNNGEERIIHNTVHTLKNP